MKTMFKHFTRDRVTTGMELVGFASLLVGIGTFSLPIAAIIGGIILIAAGMYSA
jgi:hypothetical protein